LNENVDYLISEVEANRRQMEVNAAFAKRYEEALWEIAKLCGWSDESGCTGCPQDADVVALQYVRDALTIQPNRAKNSS